MDFFIYTWVDPSGNVHLHRTDHSLSDDELVELTGYDSVEEIENLYSEMFYA